MRSLPLLVVVLLMSGCADDSNDNTPDVPEYTAAASMCTEWNNFARAVLQSYTDPPPQLSDLGVTSTGFLRASFTFSECIQQWQFQVVSATVRDGESAEILLQEFTNCVEPGTNTVGTYGQCDPDWTSDHFQVFVSAPFVDDRYTYSDSVADSDDVNRFNLTLEIELKGERHTVGVVPGQLGCFEGDPADCRACANECDTRECGIDSCGNDCGTCSSGICANGTCSSSSSSADECDQCLAGCQGTTGCCTGSGCLCYEECSLNNCSGDGVELCCNSMGDCFCMPPAQCPF